jgi:Protein of unknown function (DUF2971)
MPSFYRFRSLDALLGQRQELEAQEIYFAAPDELNDPMEGYKDLIWNGDEIAWANLLRHYLLCLVQTFSAAAFLGQDYKPSLSRGFVFSSVSSLPTEALRGIYEEVCKEFFAREQISELPSLLAACRSPFRREGLEFILSAVHGIALGIIIGVHRKSGRLPTPPAGAPDATAIANPVESLVRVLERLKTDGESMNQEALSALFQASSDLRRHHALGLYVGSEDSARKLHSVFHGYPDEYLDALGQIVYANWATACFVSAEPTDAAMWAYYGDNHKGVCLRFAAQEGAADPVMQLHGITGWHSTKGEATPSYGDLKIPFEQVSYVDRLPEIDFFRSIGRLPAPKLEETWYRGEGGKRSRCGEDVAGDNEQAWRDRYLKAFGQLMKTKLTSWRSEAEYRLALSSPLGTFDDASRRLLTYRFSDLERIVFGIRTPIDEKRKIIEIVDKKCRETGRPSFDFGQATYNPRRGNIEIRAFQWSPGKPGSS